MNDRFGVSLDVSNGFALALIGAGVLYLVYRGYRLHPVLLFTRSLVVVGFLGLLAEPTLSLNYGTTRKPLIAVLVDDSESMQFPVGDERRADTVLNVLRDPVWSRLTSRARVARFRFSGRTEAWDGRDTLAFRGPSTDLTSAIRHVVKQTDGEGLVGLVVLSDGVVNVGDRPGSARDIMEVPVYATTIGAGDEPVDLSLSWWGTPPMAFVGTPIDLRVMLRATGVDRVHTFVEALRDEETVATLPVETGEGEQSVSVRVVPDRAGSVTYRLVVTPVEDEVETRNNAVLVRVDVREKQTRVLLAGHPSADFAYLRRTLEADVHLDIDVRPVIRSSSLSLSQALMRPYAFGVAILHDLAVDEMGMGLADFVREGGGLLVVGGTGSALTRPGSLADVLPVRSDDFAERSLTVELPERALGHPALSGGREVPSDPGVWRNLPPLAGTHERVQMLSGAEVLAKDQVTGAPVAVAGRASEGKVIVFAGRGFWRYGLMSLGYGRETEDPSRFWRAAVRWLATRESVERLRVETDRAVYRSGEPIRFRAQLFDALLDPVDGARVRVSVEGEAPRSTILASIGDGRYEGALRGLPQGVHTCRVLARASGGQEERIEREVTVGRYSIEFERLGVDVSVLKRIAERTGGRHVEPGELPELLDSLNLAPQPSRVSVRKRGWGGTWPFWVIALALCGEWVWRRGRGMV